MALLSDLFGLPNTATPQRADELDMGDLLRRAVRLNQGVTTAQAVESMPPPLETRDVREYPVASEPAAPAPAPAAVAMPPAATFQPREITLGDRLRHAGLALQGRDTQALGRSNETENLTVKMLMDRGGLPQEQAIAIARNPSMLNTALGSLFGPKPANFDLAPGSARYGPTGNLIARNDERKPQLHSIAPGAALADESGNIIAQNDPRAKEPPAGYEWIDPRDPSKGVAAIAGGPATKGTGELAGKLALMKTARDAIKATKGALTEAWGVSGAIQSGLSDALPMASGAIGEAQRNVRAGIEAALRVMTGAAAPETEVVRYMNLFGPNARDSKQSAEQKLGLLERFMDEAEAFARQGHLTRDEMAARKAPAAAPKPAGAADPLGIR